VKRPLNHHRQTGHKCIPSMLKKRRPFSVSCPLLKFTGQNNPFIPLSEAARLSAAFVQKWGGGLLEMLKQKCPEGTV